MAKNKYNSQEKSIWKKGFFAGLFSSKKKSKKANSKIARKRESIRPKEKNINTLNDLHRRYRARNLGALLYNGRIYDTNFKDGPVEITSETLRELREDYGGATDLETADRYVRHMRRKFGVFGKDGKWLGLIGDEKNS